MGTIDHKAYDAEIRCLSIFAMQVSVLACHVITSIITTQVGANHGVHFMTPFIPAELMRSALNPTEADVPGPLTQSKDYQLDICIKCVQEWMYLMRLLQYWYDTLTEYAYGRPVWQESKLMLFMFYQINTMLNPHSLYIRLHDIIDHMSWQRYYKEVEATDEWKFICLHGSSLDQIPFPCLYEDQRPGNEGPFYQSNGVHPQVEPMLENAPHIANTMIEALHHHDRRQSEARDHQEYSQQQDNTSSPIVDFLSAAKPPPFQIVPKAPQPLQQPRGLRSL